MQKYFPTNLNNHLAVVPNFNVFGQGMMIRPCNSTISTDAFALSLFLRSGRFNDSTRPWSRYGGGVRIEFIYRLPSEIPHRDGTIFGSELCSTYTECAVYPVPSTTSWVLYHCTVEEQQQQHVQSHCREEEDDEQSRVAIEWIKGEPAKASKAVGWHTGSEIEWEWI